MGNPTKDTEPTSKPTFEPLDFENEDVGDAVSVDGLHRTLKNRHVQLIAIGGTIGTALFVSIGFGLIEGGPGSLLIAFTMYSVFLASVNNSMAEMAVFMPVAGGWIRMGSKWVDESFGFMLGWNFYLYEAVSISAAGRRSKLIRTSS